MWLPDRKQRVVIWLTLVIAGLMWFDGAGFSEGSNRLVVLMLVAATFVVWFLQGRRAK